jgi:hypothetical protein
MVNVNKKFHPVISLSLLIKSVSFAIVFISSLLKNWIIDSMLISKVFYHFSPLQFKGYLFISSLTYEG